MCCIKCCISAKYIKQSSQRVLKLISRYVSLHIFIASAWIDVCTVYTAIPVLVPVLFMKCHAFFLMNVMHILIGGEVTSQFPTHPIIVRFALRIRHGVL